VTIPITTSKLPGIVVTGTFSPSITNANAPANTGIRSEIVAVTTDGNRSEAKAKAKRPEEVIRTLLAERERFAGTNSTADDMTLVVATIEETAGGLPVKSSQGLETTICRDLAFADRMASAQT